MPTKLTSNLPLLAGFYMQGEITVVCSRNGLAHCVLSKERTRDWQYSDSTIKQGFSKAVMTLSLSLFYHVLG